MKPICQLEAPPRPTPVAPFGASGSERRPSIIKDARRIERRHELTVDELWWRYVRSTLPVLLVDASGPQQAERHRSRATVSFRVTLLFHLFSLIKTSLVSKTLLHFGFRTLHCSLSFIYSEYLQL
jgi:hypothetical protein